jgi:large subunit ribosomal protein L9
MKVILREDLKGLGKRGDIVDVADGYARNHLLPHSKAIVASDGAVTQASKMRRARDIKDGHAREGAQAIASMLVAKTITITAKSGQGGKLFGSVTTGDISEAIEAQTKIHIDKRHLHAEPIKALGTFQVSAKLHSEVEFPVTVEVVAK